MDVSLILSLYLSVPQIQNKPDGESGDLSLTPAPGSTPASHYPEPVSFTSAPDTTFPLPHASSPPPVEKWAPVNIPRFYFPEGLSPNCSPDLNQTFANIKMAFAGLPEQKADIHAMGKITKVHTKAHSNPLFYLSLSPHLTRKSIVVHHLEANSNPEMFFQGAVGGAMSYEAPAEHGNISHQCIYYRTIFK